MRKPHNVIPRPVTLESFQFTGGRKNAAEIALWLDRYNYRAVWSAEQKATYSRGESCMELLSPGVEETLSIVSRTPYVELRMHVRVSQWIVLDVNTRQLFLEEHEAFEKKYVPDPRAVFERVSNV